MSNLSVPCRAPYVVPKLRPEDELVTLKVGRGDDVQEFKVHAALLWETSEYFRDRLNDSEEEDGTRKLFVFPYDSPDLFEMFISFISTTEIDQDISFTTLTRLFVFANTFEIPTLRNAVLDAFFLQIAAHPRSIPYSTITEIYKRTESNLSLRRLMVDVVVNIGNGRSLEQWEDDLPRAFFVDCLRVAGEEGIVPFENRKRKMAESWLEEKSGRICAEWHVHDKEEEEEEEEEAESKTGSDQSSEEEVPPPPYYPLEEIKHTWKRY